VHFRKRGQRAKAGMPSLLWRASPCKSSLTKPQAWAYSVRLMRTAWH